jgi:hypothetical protein
MRFCLQCLQIIDFIEKNACSRAYSCRQSCLQP